MYFQRKNGKFLILGPQGPKSVFLLETGTHDAIKKEFLADFEIEVRMKFHQCVSFQKTNTSLMTTNKFPHFGVRTRFYFLITDFDPNC